MTQIVIDRHKVSLEYSTNCLIVRLPDDGPKTIPLSRVDQLICLHSVTLTTQLIGQLHSRGIDLIVLNMRHQQNSFSLFADPARQAKRRCQQYQWQQQASTRLPLAKALCLHKFHLIERLLRRQGTALAATAQQAAQTAQQCADEASLRGIEGSLQRTLFDYWRSCLPERLGFLRRQRRPPTDPVNALLSLTYTLIHHEAVRQAGRHGLDTQLGFYHRLSHGRQSLACDLMEPVRPSIEQWVVNQFLQGELDQRHFSRQANNACLLGKAGRQHFYQQYNQQIGPWRTRLAASARWISRQLDQSIAEEP